MDYPFGSNAASRVLLDTLPLGPDDRAKIAGGNAQRLLGLKPQPTPSRPDERWGYLR